MPGDIVDFPSEDEKEEKTSVINDLLDIVDDLISSKAVDDIYEYGESGFIDEDSDIAVPFLADKYLLGLVDEEGQLIFLSSDDLTQQEAKTLIEGIKAYYELEE